MTKSERRWLKILTVLVAVLLVASITPLVYVFGRDIYESFTESGKDEVERDVFADCAYIAQAHMNCYDDTRQISDYA